MKIMNSLVEKITEEVLGVLPQSVEPILEKGRNNQVFKIVTNDSVHILRLSIHDAAEQLRLYEKEKWCAEVVRKAGVLTPQITHVGVADGHAYSFQEYIAGTDGRETDRQKVWFALGQMARTIHQILASHIKLDYKEKVQNLFADDFFTQRGVFSADLSEQIKQRLEEVQAWEFAPTLCHGNLSPTNTIVDTEERVWLLDWETATGNKTPLSDLAEIYTWNTGKENIGAFCRGYDLSETAVANMMRDLQTLILLRLVDVIKRKVVRSKQEEWKDDVYITEQKKRFALLKDFGADILFTKNL